MPRIKGEKAPVGESEGSIKETSRLTQSKDTSATPRIKITNKSTEGEGSTSDHSQNAKGQSKDGESSSSSSSSTAASSSSATESSDKHTRASDDRDHDDASGIRKRIPFDKLVKPRAFKAEAELDPSARAMSPGILTSSLRVASPSAAHKAKQVQPKPPKVYTSHLDFVPSSSLQQSEFWGFFSLLTIFASGYLTKTLYLNKISTGYLIDTQLLHTLTEGLHTVALIIGAMVLYSWGAFVLQLLVTKGMGGYRLVADGLPAIILQHSMQSGLFVMGIVEVSKRSWPIVQTGFLVLEMLVLFMKMHSYTMVNRELDLVYRSKVAHGTLTDEERESPKCYPNNVTFSNYLDYLLVPSMVYQTDFARIATIRPWYCVQKVFHCFGALALGYTISAQYVLPVMQNVPHISFIQAVMSLITPFLLLYLLVFWIIFECVCNFFAEITRYADRRFYDDWWNSQSWDEFARKWNRPVHHFLARHVYFHLINKHNLSNQGAMFTTFLFSAVLHELVMASMFRLFRPYLLAMMMLQIPLIQLGRIPAIRRYPRAGNIIFWFGMLVGPPLLAVSYAREYCVHLESGC